MYFPRHPAFRLKKLLGSFPVVVVSGARQSGKTTLLKHELPSWNYVVFDPVRDVAGARSDPDLFLRTHKTPLILDEIQYAPALVAAIKRHVDFAGGTAGRFVLTGSQQWQVLKNVAESLAGRAAFLDLEGFSLAEQTGMAKPPSWLQAWLAGPARFGSRPHRRIGLQRSLYEILWRGALPQACLLELDMIPDFWAGYQRTYVERDARLMADISDWQQFGMFLRLLCSLTAQEINFSQLGREIGITPQTARRWLRVLQGTFQWYEVPAFGTNMIKRVSTKPKGCMADTGLVCHALQFSSPDALAGHVMYGPLFETMATAELRKQISLLPGPAGLHHWRSSGGAEVDLVIERDGILFPVEIKGTTNPLGNDASGLHAFMKTYPKLTAPMGLLIAPVEEVRRISDTVTAIPWDLLT